MCGQLLQEHLSLLSHEQLVLFQPFLTFSTLSWHKYVHYQSSEPISLHQKHLFQSLLGDQSPRPPTLLSSVLGTQSLSLHASVAAQSLPSQINCFPAKTPPAFFSSPFSPGAGWSGCCRSS